LLGNHQLIPSSNNKEVVEMLLLLAKLEVKV
jgi:hypothetical protein